MYLPEQTKHELKDGSLATAIRVSRPFQSCVYAANSAFKSLVYFIEQHFSTIHHQVLQQLSFNQHKPSKIFYFLNFYFC